MAKAKYYVPDERPWFKHYPDGVPHHIDYLNKPLYHLIDEAAEKSPDSTAMVFYGREMKYKELKELSDRFAHYLQKLGVQKGDRVAILLPNCPQFVIAFWGILKAGACVTSMNPGYTERELSEILSSSGAEVILTLKALYPRLKNIQKQTKVKKVITTTIADYFPLPLKIAFNIKNFFKQTKNSETENVFQLIQVLSDSSNDYHESLIETEKDLAVLQYTGGTTGKPKGVMLTHWNLMVNTAQLKYWFPLEQGKEVLVCIVPFFHIGGITSSLTWGCCGAAKLVILPRFHTKPTLKAITKYKATAFIGVPAIYIALDSAIRKNKEKYSIDSLKLVGGGMTAFPHDLFDIYKERYGKRLIEGYGLTENAGVTFHNVNIAEKEYRPGSVGFPFPDTDVKIVDRATGMILGPDEAGEICLRGPHITIGYWQRPEENKKALKNEWLYTGDIGKMDKDGYFYVLGRKDNVIGVKGFQVYPREIENVLDKTDLVAEAAVVGIPDDYTGQKIIAYIVPEPGQFPTEKELLEICRKNLVEYKVPSKIKIKKELPRSPVRKILKYVLREEAIKEEKT